MCNESQQNFDSITPLFSNCMSDNGAMKNNRVMTPKSHSDSWLITSIKICHPLRGCPKRDNYIPSYLTCMTHVRHVGLKRVTHRFCYTTYAFNKTLYMKNEGPYTCSTEEQRSPVQSDGRREALITGAAKKNKHVRSNMYP
jgi:hypothetical protein